MKKFKLFKTLLIAIGLLVTGLTSLVWAYNCNYANVYYDNSVTQWTYVQLLYEKSDGSTGWNMSHVAHTDLYWKAPGEWGSNNFSGVRFSDGTSSDWGWSTQNSWNRTGNAKVECSGFFGGDIANNVHLFTCNIKTYDSEKVDIGHPYYGSNPTILNKTVNVGSKTKVGNNDYDDGVASVAAISMQHYSFNSKIYANVQDYYDSNVPTHPKGSTSTYTIYPTYTSNVTYSFSDLTSCYEFVGWYDGEGTLLSNDEEYTKYTTSDYDVYAYFAQTHTVTIGKEGSGTVSPSGDQTVGQNPVAISATPSPGYYFNGWDYTGGVNIADASATSTTITATAAGTVTAKFLPIWRVACSVNTFDTDANPITNITSSAGAMTSGYVEIDLDANTDYSFKVYNKQTDKWWGYNSEVSKIEYTSASKTRALTENSGNDQTFRTAGAGNYRFTWTVSGGQVTLGYPTSYKVTYNDNGSTGGSVPTDNDYYASGATVTVKTNSGSLAKTGYTYGGWNTQANGSGTNYTAGTGTFSITANTTLFAKWTQTISLDREGGATGSESLAATYNATLNLSSYTPPTKEGYTFAGYWTGDNGTGSMVIDANGDVQTSVTVATVNWTDGTGKWIHPGSSTLYAKWTDNGTYVFSGATDEDWTDPDNWTKGAVPTSTADVILLAEVETPSGTTTVNSVRIATSGSYTPIGGSAITAGGKLTVSGGTALKVVTDIQNCEISENAPAEEGPTTSDRLEIADGGALAWNGGGSPGNATVGFYTCSGGVPGSNEAVNQYIGIPFTSLNSDAYYNAWVFAVSGSTWAEISGKNMSPWTGYNIIEKKAEKGTTGGSYSLTGELVSSSASLGSGATAGSETLYANSWVAPINIAQISFSGTETLYMFGAQSAKDIKDEDEPMGNYSTKPKNEGGYIPSMQSFSILTGTTISSLNYSSAVYGSLAAGNNVNFAPRRARQADYRQAIWDTQDSLFVTVKTASGWGDVLKMFIHEDFSQNYENGWDGPKMEGMWEAPKLYTVNNEGEMAVSCVPSVDNNVIAFHAGTASNEYTFTFKYSGEDELVLKDTKTGIETPIVDGETYDFTSESSDDDMRFVIKKVPTVVTDVDNISDNASGVQKIMHNGTMYIVRDGRIYDAQGALVK